MHYSNSSWGLGIRVWIAACGSDGVSEHERQQKMDWNLVGNQK